jgi:hypothetical protein
VTDAGKFIDIWRQRHPDSHHYTYFSYRFNCREKSLGWRLDMCTSRMYHALGMIADSICCWQLCSARESWIRWRCVRLGAKSMGHLTIALWSWRLIVTFWTLPRSNLEIIRLSV